LGGVEAAQGGGDLGGEGAGETVGQALVEAEVEEVAGFAAEFGDFAAATEVGDEGDGLGGLGFVI
jgi:hypothetical protein